MSLVEKMLEIFEKYKLKIVGFILLCIGVYMTHFTEQRDVNSSGNSKLQGIKVSID